MLPTVISMWLTKSLARACTHTSHLTDRHASTTHSRHRIDYRLGNARPPFSSHLLARRDRSTSRPNSRSFFGLGPGGVAHQHPTCQSTPNNDSYLADSSITIRGLAIAAVTLPRLTLMITTRAGRYQPSVPSNKRQRSILLREFPSIVSRWLVRASPLP